MKVERGVPIPTDGRVQKTETKVSVLKAMKHGDSVFFTDKNQAVSFLACGRQYLNRGLIPSNYHFISRQVEGGFRVWKIETKEQKIEIAKSESDWLDSVQAMDEARE